MPRQEMHLRPETPTRALLRRVQRRSLAAANTNIPPPPLPTRGGLSSTKVQEEERSGIQESLEQYDTASNVTQQEEEEEIEALACEFDQMHQDADQKDARIRELEISLKEALLRSSLNVNSSSEVVGSKTNGGLTRAAAAKLEREFASQELILQGLQKDNEAKTIEVEKLRREKKVMSDYLARQYGSDDWESVVFGASSSYMKVQESEKEAVAAAAKLSSSSSSSSPPLPMEGSQRLALAGLHAATTLRSSKGPLGRVARTSEGLVADSSFYSADETFEEKTLPPSSPSPSVATPDLSTILSLIEAQRLLIKGFERSNALKMVECQEKVKLAKEREETWGNRLTVHQQTLNVSTGN